MSNRLKTQERADNMTPNILFENIWSDDDMVELEIVANDGKSSFANTVYVSYIEIEELVNTLDIFKTHLFGGIYDIEFGKFGPEYANGAFYSRLHFKQNGKLFISTKMQSQFFDFGIKNVANEVALYMISQPILLDKFINDFKNISNETGNIAVLECMSL